jgi:putative SOS response-associated peptidase YedK
MCGCFVQYSDPEIHATQFDPDTLCEAKSRYNVAPTQPVLAIRETEDNKRELIPLRWGLAPSWSKGPDNRYRL